MSLLSALDKALQSPVFLLSILLCGKNWKNLEGDSSARLCSL